MPDADRGRDESALREAVADLERRGVVVRVRGEKLSLIEYTDFQAGTLAVRGEGRAFLLSGEPGVPDLPVGRQLGERARRRLRPRARREGEGRAEGAADAALRPRPRRASS